MKSPRSPRAEAGTRIPSPSMDWLRSCVVHPIDGLTPSPISSQLRWRRARASFVGCLKAHNDLYPSTPGSGGRANKEATPFKKNPRTHAQKTTRPFRPSLIQHHPSKCPSPSRHRGSDFMTSQLAGCGWLRGLYCPLSSICRGGSNANVDLPAH